MSERHEAQAVMRAPALAVPRVPHEPSPLHALQQAAAESAQALDPALRARMEAGLGRDFSGVRVHSGPASARAAARIGARAYTLGNDIHLGDEAHWLSAAERGRLLVHEAVHTAQQGGSRVAPHAGLSVGRPGDGAEREAERVADALHRPSPWLALHDRLQGPSRATPLPIEQRATPQLQRDLSNKLPVNEGDFKLDLKTESHPGAKSGMSGTIKFKANDKAPDSNNIRLLQVVRDKDLSTGKDYLWTGGEANRNKMMTAEDKGRGIEGGFFVDHSAAATTPRTKAGDAAVSPYYRDYWPNATQSQDGSKKGKAISEASLWDYPGSSARRAFSFETVAKAADTGHVYGTVMWGFTIADPAKGKLEKERAVGRNVTLLTTDKAIEKFNEFYRNPGASTAP